MIISIASTSSLKKRIIEGLVEAAPETVASKTCGCLVGLLEVPECKKVKMSSLCINVSYCIWLFFASEREEKSLVKLFRLQNIDLKNICFIDRIKSCYLHEAEIFSKLWIIFLIAKNRSEICSSLF